MIIPDNTVIPKYYISLKLALVFFYAVPFLKCK